MLKWLRYDGLKCMIIIIMIIYHHTFENVAAKPAIKFDIT